MNMYILIYIDCTEGVWGMHVRRNYPPCIRRRNKECCLLTLHWCYEVYSRIFGDKGAGG